MVSRSRACSTSPTTTLGPRRRRPAARSARPSSGVEQRRLARAVRSEHRDPLSGADGEVDRAEPERAAVDDGPLEAGDDVAAAPGRRHRQLQPPRLPGLGDDLEPLDRPLGAGGPTGELLGLVDAEGADVLVRFVGRRPPHLGQPLAGPLPLALRPLGERSALLVVLLEALPGMAPGRLPLVEIALPPAGEVARPVGELVELDHVRHRAGEKRAVMAHQDHRGVEPGHPALDPVEPVEIEVVGRLVEQEDVEPGEQQGGQARSGGLPAGQRRRRFVEQPGRQPEVRPHLADAGVEVGAAQAEPTVEGGGVVVVGTGPVGGERSCGRVEVAVGGRHARPAGEVGAHGLGRRAGRLLGQVADGGGRRGAEHPAPIRRDLAGQGAQQRRLADTIGPDDPDALARRDDQVDAVEHGERAANNRQIAGTEGSGGWHRRNLAGSERTKR